MKTAIRRLLWRIVGRGLFNYRYLRRPDSLYCESATTQGVIVDDEALIDAVISNYRRSAQASGESMWSDFFREFHAEIDHAFRHDRERAAEILRDPITSDLFYGFDNLCRSLGSRLEDKRAPQQTLDALIGFAESVGVRRIDNPEAYRLARPVRIDPDALLADIDKALGVSLPVPNPYRGHFGLKTSRGVVTYRVPQAMYQAWRITQLAPGGRVLEIGGGLGFTALYAHTLGIRDYTIVDIPVSAAAQRYFLGRCGVPVTLQTPEEFHADTSRYDLIVNVDSLTEMDRAVAERYIAAIRLRASAFLSINHESNAFTVRELMPGMTRHPYWLRRGYVEEVAQFS